MKITKQRLKEIIKEELSRVLPEARFQPDTTGAIGAGDPWRKKEGWEALGLQWYGAGKRPKRSWNINNNVLAVIDDEGRMYAAAKKDYDRYWDKLQAAFADQGIRASDDVPVPILQRTQVPV